MTGGKPLRFLGLTLAGWTLLRTFALWPSVEPLREAARHLGFGRAAAITPPMTMVQPNGSSIIIPERAASGKSEPLVGLVATPPSTTSPPIITRDPFATSVARDRHNAVASSPPPLVPTPLAAPPRRFAGSAWLIARGGANDALLGGQLGASQAGARLTYTLDRGHRIALAARLATPLRGKGREAAVGIDWQPMPTMPVHVVAEQRFFLDGGRGGPSLSVIGGIGPRPLAAGLVIEAYGQAGGILRGQVDGFADGLARVSHPVARLGQARLDLGVGAWGGVQRGAGRFDVGPSVALAFPVAGKAIRVSADWRERVAGHARPGSGPALSVGSDF